MKIINKKIIHKGWSTLYSYTLQLLNKKGESKEVKREIYNSGDGATVLLYDPERKVVTLIKQFRLATLLQGHKNGYILECCAGMLDNLEPEAAIKKEILEETGIKVDKVEPLFSAYSTPGAHMEKTTFFTAPYKFSDKVHEGGGRDDENEDLEVIEYSFSQIKNMLYNGELEDAKTIILIQYGIMNGLLD